MLAWHEMTTSLSALTEGSVDFSRLAYSRKLHYYIIHINILLEDIKECNGLELGRILYST